LRYLTVFPNQIPSRHLEERPDVAQGGQKEVLEARREQKEVSEGLEETRKGAWGDLIKTRKDA